MQWFTGKAADEVSESTLPRESGLRWQRATAPGHYNNVGTLDLASVLGEGNRYCYAFAVTRISVRTAGTYTMTASGDDALTILRNGRLLLDQPASGPVADHMRHYKVPFEPGEHIIVAGISQKANWWQFVVRFADAKGQPTDDIVGLAL